jgi:hypothetical protein
LCFWGLFWGVALLNQETIKKIESFVKTRPRTVEEISKLLEKNWRTADNYIKRIASEQGTIKMHTFREGSRGALKIVYTINEENFHSSAYQERLFTQISSLRKKQDFNPFDIYQHVPINERRAFLEKQTELEITEKQGLTNALRSAENQVLIFSGNLSWAITRQGKTFLLSLLEELIIRKIPIKILCDVDLESLDNISEVLSLNEKHKTELIEIRHSEQPLRAFIVDSKFARFKQHKQKNTFIFYEITDEEWVVWIQKTFWEIFRKSIGAKQRIKDLKSIETIK